MDAEQAKTRSIVSRVRRLVLCAGAVAGVAFLVTPPSSADPQEVAARLIAALERFHERHGRYPADTKAVVSEGILSAVPRVPWNLGLRREGFDYSADPSGDFYLLYYSEQDWFGGVGPASVKTYSYPSAFRKWTRDPIFPENQALELAARRFVEEGSSKRLKSFVSVLNSPLYSRIREEDVATVLNVGEPCLVEGLPGVIVRATDAEAAGYRFLLETREIFGEVVHEVSAIDRLVESGHESIWEQVFRPR